MNITVIFWAFYDLSSVGGMTEKLKSLMTLKTDKQRVHKFNLHRAKSMHTPPPIFG